MEEFLNSTFFEHFAKSSLLVVFPRSSFPSGIPDAVPEDEQYFSLLVLYQSSGCLDHPEA
jgi:hypothetical protein